MGPVREGLREVASPVPRTRLRARLSDLVASFGREHLTPDPLEVVLGFDGPRDVEVAGFLAAAMAFGSAVGARTAAADLLARLDGSPGDAVSRWDSRRDGRRLAGWRQRWLGPRDAAAALTVLRRALDAHGTLEGFFAAGDPGPGEGDPLGAALASFSLRALALAPRGAPERLRYWFAGPQSGGAAKRLCLWLRWMCRRDQLDPGPWTAVDRSRLVVPLDVHVARIARYTGLLTRRTSDWKAALEVTAALRRLDPADPVRFDYAICRLGILDLCPRRRDIRLCKACPLYDVCLL